MPPHLEDLFSKIVRNQVACPNYHVTLQARQPLEGCPAELKTWGDHIKKVRLLRKLNQRQAAEAMGVPYWLLTPWETEHATPVPCHRPTVLKFLRYLPWFLVPSTVGQAIRTLRSLLGLNQQQLADEIKVHGETLKLWELDTKLPNPASLNALEQFILAQKGHELLEPYEFVKMLRQRVQASDGYQARKERAQRQARKADHWGKHICKTRARRQLSLAHVAQVLGIRKGLLRTWENTGRKPEIRYLPYIIAFLGYVPYFVIPRTGNAGEKLRFIREIHGLSSKALAQILGISADALELWERGKKKPQAKGAALITAVFQGDITLPYLPPIPAPENQSASAGQAEPSWLPALAFGMWLKRERGKRELSRRQLAQRLGVIPTTIARWEQGFAKPNGENEEKLKKELGSY